MGKSAASIPTGVAATAADHFGNCPIFGALLDLRNLRAFTIKQTFIPRSLVSADRTCKHGGASATPPSASLYRERIFYNDREVWLS
jgi:hypothetical protein